MKLEGIHHVTAITADAPGNVDFYARLLGLRLVKKTVNQDDPTVYHLFYADEDGSPGADITFFEYPGARQGRAGAGMVHRVVFRVADDAALAFWADRLAAESVETRREVDSLLFEDPEGLGLELRVVQTPDKPLVAISPDIPAEVALQGFDEVRAFTRDPDRSSTFLEDVLGFQPRGEEGWEVRGEARGGNYVYDRAESLGTPGAGTVHHVAFASLIADHKGWEQRVAEAGAHPTPIIDRFYFRSIYFREPSGVLFEIATIGPGFATDEPKESLGERLSLPPAFEHLREQIEPRLSPISNPRTTAEVSG
jgi:glyoxalase family protein